ncbi:MAG: hypothetical protein K9H16_06465 [Bacteroidales bacterium]|nr:hypothetical protein [Bacteroidales bacterium]
MKATTLSTLLIVFLVSGLLGQPPCEKLSGYWMELDEENFNSLSTLIVFNTNENGAIEGSVFFLKSEDKNREFELSKIEINQTELSFIIENTSISFIGKLDEKDLCFSGAFYLDGKTVIAAKHQKLDEQKVKKLCNPPMPRKIIDHTDGVMTG